MHTSHRCGSGSEKSGVRKAARVQEGQGQGSRGGEEEACGCLEGNEEGEEAWCRASVPVR